jgi:hypothetical protein
MGEYNRVPDVTKINQQKQDETGTDSSSDTRSCGRNHVAHGSLEEPPLDKSEEAVNREAVQRRSRKVNTSKPECFVRKSRFSDAETSLANRSRYQQLKRDYRTIQSENDRLTEELDKLKDDNMIQKHYANRYHCVVERILIPYAQERRFHFDDRTDDTLDFVLSPLLQDAQEAETLRGQIQTLQNELLSREKATAAISDEIFAKDFSKLAAQIKTLSRLLRPYEDLDVVERLGSCILARGVEPRHWDSRVGKKLFIEAWTWSILMQMTFRDPFTIFGVESKTIANLWARMYGTQHCHGWPTPSPPCETWRYRTMEQLVTVADENIIRLGQTKANHLYFEQCLVDARASVITTIETGLATITSMVDSSLVLQIVNEAFTLSKHMSLQHPRLQVLFPRNGDIFDTTEMKQQTILDEEDGIAHGMVAAIVNPGLMKWGDVQCKNFDHRYAIVPALVRLHAP